MRGEIELGDHRHEDRQRDQHDFSQSMKNPRIKITVRMKSSLPPSSLAPAHPNRVRATYRLRRSEKPTNAFAAMMIRKIIAAMCEGPRPIHAKRSRSLAPVGRYSLILINEVEAIRGEITAVASMRTWLAEEQAPRSTSARPTAQWFLGHRAGAFVATKPASSANTKNATVSKLCKWRFLS